MMREVLQRHLRPPGGEEYRIVGCRIASTRYQPGVRYAVHYALHYALHLPGRGTGRELNQLVTGLIYAGSQTRRVWESLQGRPGAGEPIAPVFAPFSYLPGLDKFVQVFPDDHRLLALPILIAGPPPEFEAPLLTRFGPGEWRLEAWEAAPRSGIRPRRGPPCARPCAPGTSRRAGRRKGASALRFTPGRRKRRGPSGLCGCSGTARGREAPPATKLPTEGAG